MDIIALQNSIKRELLAPVYLFYGEENYLQDKYIEKIKEKVLTPQTRDFNFDILEGREVSLETVAQAASTLPFMAEKRLVVVKEAQFFKARGKNKGDEVSEDQKIPVQEQRLLEYLGNPSPYTCLIFITSEGVDKRKKLYKQVEQVGQVVEFAPLRGGELRNWLVQKAGQNGKKIEPQALAKLAEGGGSLRQLEAEIEKLVTFVGTSPDITIKDVDGIVTKPVDNTIFEMVDALGEKKLNQALAALHGLLFDGEPPVRILFMIARQFRLLLRAKAMTGEGYSEKQVASGLQVHPFVAQKILKQGKNFSGQDLSTALSRILEADVALKSTQQPPVLVLELLILSLAVKN